MSAHTNGGTPADATRWNAMASRLGSLYPTGNGSPTTLRRVRYAIRQPTGTPAEIELTVLIAASHGKLRQQLTGVRKDRAKRGAEFERTGAVEPNPRALKLLVIAILTAALGPVLSFVSVAPSDTFLVDGGGALISGIVMIAAALWFIGTEVVKSPLGGSRLGMYDDALVSGLAVWSVFGVGALAVRLDEDPGSGGALLGLLLQIATVVLYVVTAVAASRNRRDAVTTAQANAPGLHREQLEAFTSNRMLHVLSRSTSGELDRPAVAEGLRDLVERRVLSLSRAEWLLRVSA
ncbi:hypothetical protein ACLRGF_02595 [Mycetocola zhadangensis]|uniref:hypothetical protein n=1 Tax=Mycetocola zhadangensis TaxID=1164595 RepID=UPI003A4E10EA